MATTKNTTKKVEAKAVTSNSHKHLEGVVTSDKMKDTIVVLVSRFVKHPKYGKFMTVHKKFKAHDSGNTKKIGDKVTIEECAPISKEKHFRIV